MGCVGRVKQRFVLVCVSVFVGLCADVLQRGKKVLKKGSMELHSPSLGDPILPSASPAQGGAKLS